MSHFAKVENGIVTQVIVIEQDVVDTGLFGDPSSWVQTSYNTYGGVHRLGGTPMRKNYAGIGCIYDVELDAFYSPQPFPSWTLNSDSCIWQSPVPKPIDDKMYDWNEETTSWVEHVDTITSVIEGLEPTIVPVIEVSEVESEPVSVLSTNDLNTIDIPSLTIETVSALSTSDVSSLSTSQVSALSTSQI